MKRFRFRLKRLLDVRRIEEDQAALALRRAMQTLGAIEERIMGLRAEHQTLYRDLGVLLARGTTDPAAPVQTGLHAGRIERLVRAAERERDDAAQAVRTAQQELQKRKAARRAFEQLEEKERAAWAEESRREENAFLDEVAGTRFANRTR